MCKDTKVYDMKTNQVLNNKLMPCISVFLNKWRKSRLFLRGINRIPEEDERELADSVITVMRKLSLSDCYWFRYDKDANTKFDDITPYKNEFTEYGVKVSDKSAPSLTLTGSINKIWKRTENKTVISKTMLKQQVEAEVLAVRLAQKLNLSVNEVKKISENEIYIYNLTDKENMLMRLQKWDIGLVGRQHIPREFGFILDKVQKAYHKLGIDDDFALTTILFDSVVSNYDRAVNLSNWGYFKSPDTGTNRSAPMYDFNLAHPHQKNMYLHYIKGWLAEEHKTLLNKWLPIVENHGVESWVWNIRQLLGQ